MSILEVGQDKKEYDQACVNCGTKFAFLIGEVNDGNIRCPHCSAKLEAKLNRPIKTLLKG